MTTSSSSATIRATVLGLALAMAATLLFVLPASPASADPSFACSHDGGSIEWSDHGKNKYWVYKSMDDGKSFNWTGRSLGEAKFNDRNHRDGAKYQVHYRGIPRANCSNDSSAPASDAPKVEAPADNKGAFSCAHAGGNIEWSDHGQSKYWVYKSMDDGKSYKWTGRSLGEAKFSDRNHRDGAKYQVHYQGIPRVNCADDSSAPVPMPEPKKDDDHKVDDKKDDDASSGDDKKADDHKDDDKKDDDVSSGDDKKADDHKADNHKDDDKKDDDASSGDDKKADDHKADDKKDDDVSSGDDKKADDHKADDHKGDGKYDDGKYDDGKYDDKDDHKGDDKSERRRRGGR